MQRKLRKIEDDERLWIGGVCAGMAYWGGIPVWITRILCLFAAALLGFPIIIYLVLWIFLPTWDKTPDDFEKVTGD